MYKQFFSLKQSPFSIAPDPRYLYMSERHREALAHLLYGVGSGGGFVLLTGEIGAGKTTVCRCFIEQIPADCRLAYIFNPKLTVEELLLSICDEFRIDLPPAPAGAVSVKSYVDAINRYLLASHAQGKNNVLIIDEAQNLSADVLEQLRLLTNLETSERKLLQIILIGQPELRAMLARPELEQLAQRVIARYHLGSLTEAETASYIAHRLAVAGGGSSRPFPRSVMPQVFQLSQGVPRRINLLCDRALLGAYVENSREVTRTILRRAGSEVFSGGANPPAPKKRWPAIGAGVAAAAVISAAAAWQMRPSAPALQAAAPVAVAATVLAAAPQSRAAPAASAPPVASTPRVAVTPLAHASEQEALRPLAALWGVALPAGATCDDVLKLNLRCHQSKGGLYELRLLDRPAILTLRDGAQVSYALLTGMDDTHARLSVDGKEQKIDIGALATRSDGSFVTLWTMPRYYRDQVSAGEQGADVDWIASRLAKINGLVPPAADRPLSGQTVELLRTFQTRQNLKADGVAGPRTYMRLNQLTGVAEPRLLAASATGKP
ncbi:ExeA family protein [Massilia pseudoviolaceinigra]|uniref:ExeA family protein n=1 Tax=Massilia pseudoviolaceinigra TaxID=3057165 RepID=UPI0027966811|nr:ExeA family protein [Massilia sp. CCM 9206]MDQ1924417.1 AAA family ATPase [Massilia sp. CCM 9206]